MLQLIVDYILYTLVGLDSTLNWVSSLNFFIYDSIKIILLLFILIGFFGFLRTYISHEKVKKWVNNRRYGSGNFFASMFGALTPFCSCSSIPLFIGFLEAGIPLGVTFSFLITSPLVNEYLVILMFGFFGWKITLAYVISGILIGTVLGIILGKMNLEKYIVKDLVASKTSKKHYVDLKSRIIFGLDEAKSLVKKLWVWIIIGVGLGALIHNHVPQDLVQGFLDKGGIFSVPIATLIGVPIYGSCAAILPIAAALFQKGFPLGTALSFMMATSALSLSEAVILRRAIKLKLILIFFGIVTIGIIFIGYVFNLLQNILI